MHRRSRLHRRTLLRICRGRKEYLRKRLDRGRSISGREEARLWPVAGRRCRDTPIIPGWSRPARESVLISGDIYRPRFARFGFQNALAPADDGGRIEPNPEAFTGLGGRDVAGKLPVIIDNRGDNTIVNVLRRLRPNPQRRAVAKEGETRRWIGHEIAPLGNWKTYASSCLT